MERAQALYFTCKIKRQSLFLKMGNGVTESDRLTGSDENVCIKVYFAYNIQNVLLGIDKNMRLCLCMPQFGASLIGARRHFKKMYFFILKFFYFFGSCLKFQLKAHKLSHKMACQLQFSLILSHKVNGCNVSQIKSICSIFNFVFNSRKKLQAPKVFFV